MHSPQFLYNLSLVIVGEGKIHIFLARNGQTKLHARGKSNRLHRTPQKQMDKWNFYWTYEAEWADQAVVLLRGRLR